MSTEYQTYIHKGVPPLATYGQRHGYYTAGRTVVEKLLKQGVGHYSVTRVPSEAGDRKNVISFTGGARKANSKKGSPLTISQRKCGSYYRITIAFKSDLT